MSINFGGMIPIHRPNKVSGKVAAVRALGKGIERLVTEASKILGVEEIKDYFVTVKGVKSRGEWIEYLFGSIFNWLKGVKVKLGPEKETPPDPKSSRSLTPK